VAEAEVETAKLNLEFCSIHSPIDGRVSRENVSIGNLVTPNTSADGILTTVVAVDPLYAYMDVDESAILKYIQLSKEGKLKTARESRVTLFLGLQNEEGFPHEGFVDFVDNRITPGTGTMRVRGQWKNWDPLLTPGFFVRVRAAASPQYKALLVPDDAVGVDQGQRFVFVVDADKKVQYRTVKLGTLSDGYRVIREGLKPGELIIVNGLMRAQPGALVDPEMAPTAPPKVTAEAEKK
jgi:RND family efflux transporter MFP subunit